MAQGEVRGEVMAKGQVVALHRVYADAVTVAEAGETVADEVMQEAVAVMEVVSAPSAEAVSRAAVSQPSGPDEECGRLTADDGLVDAASRCAALVLDTETTGLSGDVIQMAAVLLDAEGGEMAVYNRLWRTELPIEPRAEQVHGISVDRLRRDGVPAAGELALLMRVFAAARAAGARLVAHNARFDVARLRQTAARHEMPDPVADAPVLCTMTLAKPRCGLLDRAGRTKAPTCAELHRLLLGAEFEGPLHDALGDSRMAARCYTAGRERGWWQ